MHHFQLHVCGVVHCSLKAAAADLGCCSSKTLLGCDLMDRQTRLVFCYHAEQTYVVSKVDVGCLHCGPLNAYKQALPRFPQEGRVDKAEIKGEPVPSNKCKCPSVSIDREISRLGLARSTLKRERSRQLTFTHRSLSCLHGPRSSDILAAPALPQLVIHLYEPTGCTSREEGKRTSSRLASQRPIYIDRRGTEGGFFAGRCQC